MRNSSTAVNTRRETKTTCVIPEALRLWDLHARELRQGRGGRRSRSLALAQLIDSFERAGKDIEHAWSYCGGQADGALRKVNFDITPERLKILQAIRKRLSDFEGADVGLGFALTALLMHQIGPKPESILPKPAKTRRVA